MRCLAAPLVIKLRSFLPMTCTHRAAAAVEEHELGVILLGHCHLWRGQRARSKSKSTLESVKAWVGSSLQVQRRPHALA